MTTTADNLHLPTDVPGAFPLNTVYKYIYDLDSVLYSCQRLIDFRVRQAEQRLDAMLKAAERRERWEWLRWAYQHHKVTEDTRTWEQQALYRAYFDGVPMAFPGQNAHRQPVAIDTEGWVNAEGLEWDALRDRYRMNEPWHFEYPFKGSRWRRIKLYLKGLFTGNWRVR